MQKYHILSRTLHWLMALLVITALTLGIYMTGLGKEVSYRYDLYDLHKSIGVLVLILVIIRLVVRVVKSVPPLPQTMSAFIRIAAHINHVLLYVLMIMVPVTGYLMSNFGGHMVKLFSIAMPSIVTTNKVFATNFHGAHVTLAYILIGFIILHLLAVIKHRFFDVKEHDVLRRMI
jgi:cytochrome b561